MRGPAGWRGPGKGGSPAGARRRRGGRFLTTTRATGNKGEEGGGALLTLLSWLLKSGVPRDGAVRGRDVLPQGRRGAGGGRFLTTTGATGGKGEKAVGALLTLLSWL